MDPTVAILEQIHVGGLREESRPLLTEFAERLRADLGDNLRSLVVVGSILTADFNPRRSDINTVVVVDRMSYQLLGVLAGYGRDMGRRRLRAPLLMTPEYIWRSLDVFGVEFLDFQLNHAAILGADPFADLTFHRECVRLQVERELKSAQIQLWQSYIRNMGRARRLGPVLGDCAVKLLALLRAMLWLINVDRPREAQPTFEKSGKEFGLPDKTVQTLLTLRREGDLPAKNLLDPMFQDVYQAVEQLSHRVDQVKVEP